MANILDGQKVLNSLQFLTMNKKTEEYYKLRGENKKSNKTIKTDLSKVCKKLAKT